MQNPKKDTLKKNQFNDYFYFKIFMFSRFYLNRITEREKNRIKHLKASISIQKHETPLTFLFSSFI